MSYGLREQAKPDYQGLIGDGKPVGEPVTNRDVAWAAGQEQALLGHKVEIIASYDGFLTFWTYTRFEAKTVDALM